MGTRADFYVGKTEADMQWLGSIAMDGYPQGIPQPMLACLDEQVWVQLLAGFLMGREDASIPERDGWPWPWTDSSLTDYSYTFYEGRVWKCHFGCRWTLDDPRTATDVDYKKCWFPDMTRFQKVTLGPRSGLIIL